MFKAIVTAVSFTLLAVAAVSSAHAGRGNGMGGINGLDMANGIETSNGLSTTNGIPTENGLIGANGVGQSNGMGTMNGQALTGAGTEGFQILTLQIERPTSAR